MSGMTQKEIGEYFEEVKRVFPDCKISEIIIQGESGLMSMIKFNKEDVGDNTNDFPPLPAGKYTGQLCNHEWKTTKAGGHMLAITLEITGPTDEGRKVFDNLNIDCASEDAQKIALRSYKAICLAANAEKFYDAIFEIDGDSADDYFAALPENLYGCNIALSIGIEKGKDNYPDKNKVKIYGAPEMTNSKPTVAPDKGKPSWAKG